MRIRQACLQFLKTVLILFVVLQLSACGALLHPERQGQKKGQIDVGIAVLHGVRLLFFIVSGGVPVVQIDLKDLNIVNIEAIVAAQTGHRISLSTSNIEISKLKTQK